MGEQGRPTVDELAGAFLSRPCPECGLPRAWMAEGDGWCPGDQQHTIDRLRALLTETTDALDNIRAWFAHVGDKPSPVVDDLIARARTTLDNGGGA